MLGAQQYPLDKKPYNETRKTKEFIAAADRRGLNWDLPKLALTFGNEGEEPAPGEPIKEEYPNLRARSLALRGKAKPVRFAYEAVETGPSQGIVNRRATSLPANWTSW
jgi:hypothetical protein